MAVALQPARQRPGSPIEFGINLTDQAKSSLVLDN
jgi:hypothetical protein